MEVDMAPSWLGQEGAAPAAPHRRPADEVKLSVEEAVAPAEVVAAQTEEANEVAVVSGGGGGGVQAARDGGGKGRDWQGVGDDCDYGLRQRGRRSSGCDEEGEVRGSNGSRMEGGGKDGDGGQDLVTTEADPAPWRTDLVWGELAAVAALRSSQRRCQRQRRRAHGDGGGGGWTAVNNTVAGRRQRRYRLLWQRGALAVAMVAAVAGRRRGGCGQSAARWPSAAAATVVVTVCTVGRGMAVSDS
ncbi:hypothetical protein OsJ_02711 [Oryza sativa Japonica Group]|uniref:Uncharacterized protein n=1 Tax=Oryza sativa subsp. japonica TaxID=39947 RepID=A2ZVP7_ORYSJ|nr:hypothetical protein OsJ_02711 [Oryza sativa Japonica Group]